jgi:hypothetical protein
LRTKAFVVANHIVFGTDQYHPTSDAGMFLLAHEVAHVVQNARSFQLSSLTFGHPASRFEHEACEAAARIVSGDSSSALSPSPAGILRCFPCPGGPVWNSISAGPKVIYEPANKAIEDAYKHDNIDHADAILFGSEFETGRDIRLPKSARNKSFGNALLRELRGIASQLRPDIIDFHDRVFFEIKTVTSAEMQPNKVKDQLSNYYKIAARIRDQFGGVTERSWDQFNATWKPPDQLIFPGDTQDKIVCTASTDYVRWGSGLILYNVLERDNDEEKKQNENLTKLMAELQKLRNLYELYSNEHKVQLDEFNRNPAGFVTGSLFNRPPQVAIWNNAYGRIVATERLINDGQVVAAAAELRLALCWYLFAYNQYYTFREGIEGAGQKMKLAIVAAAAIIIVAAAAATAATVVAVIAADSAGVAGTGAATAATGATEASSAAQAFVRVADGCDKAVRVVTAEQEFVREVEAASRAADTIPRLVKALPTPW